MGVEFYQKFIDNKRLCITELDLEEERFSGTRLELFVWLPKIKLTDVTIGKSERLITLQKENLKNKNVKWISDIKGLVRTTGNYCE